MIIVTFKVSQTNNKATSAEDKQLYLNHADSFLSRFKFKTADSLTVLVGQYEIKTTNKIVFINIQFIFPLWVKVKSAY